MQLKLEQQLEEIREQLLDCLSIDFGHIWITKEIENWPSLSWNEFSKEIGDQEITLEPCLNRSWYTFFTLEKEKYNLLKLFIENENPFEDLPITSYQICHN